MNSRQKIMYDYQACFKFTEAGSVTDTHEDLESEAL